MDVRRVAIIFDTKARPETTGVYCRRALGHLVEVEHFLPSDWSQIPRDRFDLYLNIDDGLRYHLPTELRPAAWWAIDTHLDFAWALEKAGDFDYVFAAQRDGADRLREHGIASATWLPLACDPEIHRKLPLEKKFDVSFVGNLFPGPRADLVRLIQERYPNSFVGNRYFDEMAEVFSASRVVFNRSISNDINMRVFEAAACGSLLLTNDLRENGQAELFEDGVHLATYSESEELLDKLAYYLAHETFRERVAESGMGHAHGNHTYRHRMETLLKCVERAVAKASVQGMELLLNAPDPSYYDFSRPEILALIPESAKYVLDIGCGSGRLGESLKRRQQAEIIGIEFQREPARQAQERLDRVLMGDIEEMEPDIQPGSLDAVVCGDILEHLWDPARMLRRARTWLKPEGCVVASIPNVRHHSVIRGLLEGNWTYRPAGLLDRDHVRFFTRREIEKLFYRAGFDIEVLQIVPGPGDDEWAAQGRLGEVKVGRLHVGSLPPEDAEEFYAYQYLMRAVPGERTEYGLTSIIIPVHNQLAYTRQCVESIREHTDPPYELILVDNGSSDGTAEYLRTLAAARIITNSENRGFPAAVNQGVEAACGSQVLVLNNDCVVTTGWLERMLAALHSDPKVGLVGPCSNFVSGEQQVPVTYDDIGGLDGFAWDWARAHASKRTATDRLVGFCLLIRRAVIDDIGLLDERFGLGCFEDDDYCLRAARAGYRLLIAEDAFVHHFGGRTFVGSAIPFESQMRRNQKLFEEKWSALASGGRQPPDDQPVEPDRSLGSPSAPYKVEVASGGGLRLVPNSLLLSLCMIVRDNARTIEVCLESIRPWVDEMVVVDTGSNDDTPQIAARLGARVFHFPWCDDFSAARNESLRHARGTWLFWMDSDDTISAENGCKLRELAYAAGTPLVPPGRRAEGEGAAVLGYVVQVHCPGAGQDGETNVTVVDHVKLLRNREELRFEGRIHEQVLPAIRRAEGEVGWTDIFVTHSGYDHSPEGQKRKLDRDLRLLNLELVECPEHPFTLFNLGMTHADAANYDGAIGFLKRSIAASGPGESHLRKAYALLMYAQMQSKQHAAASETCQAGLRLFPEDVELRFRKGVLLQELGRTSEAIEAYRSALESREDRHFTSVDRGIAGFKARQNLALAYTEIGELEAAEKEWRLVIDEVPSYRAGWRGLGDVLLRQGRHDEVILLAEQLDGTESLRGGASLLRGHVAAALGDVLVAGEEFERAVKAMPDDLEPLRSLARLRFEHGSPADSEPVLKELVRREPSDASAHHNLGALYLRTRRYRAAVGALEKSLELRPDFPATMLYLGYALKECHRFAKARRVFEAVLRVEPGNAAALAALHDAREPEGARPARRSRRKAALST